MLRPVVALGALAALVAVARADVRVIAVAPLSTLGAEDTSTATRTLTKQIEAAVASLGDTKVVPALAVADAIKKAKKPQLKACEGEAACVAEVGKLVGAQIVITGEVGGLGDSRVVYLGATDVASAKELRSTTLAIGAKGDGDGPNGAVVRLLDPDRYRGTLHFAVDVTGATVYVNGAKVTPGARGDLPLPVGTQAVRVTHPSYRDFVRFIDVQYGRTTDVAVAMTQYPIVERDLQGKPIRRDNVIYNQPPLWKRWYVVGPAAVGLAIVTGIIVGSLVNNFPDAPCRRVGGEPC